MGGNPKPGLTATLLRKATTMNANTTTTATKQINPGDLELTYADFNVAKIFIEASEQFLDEIRAWLNLSSNSDAKLLLAELGKGEMMLSEATARLETGMKKLHDFVEQAYALKAESK